MYFLVLLLKYPTKNYLPLEPPSRVSSNISFPVFAFASGPKRFFCHQSVWLTQAVAKLIPNAEHLDLMTLPEHVEQTHR